MGNLFPFLRNVSDIKITDKAKELKKYIVLHHSATHVGSAEVFHDYHVTHNRWRALGYHFVIGNGSLTPDGLIQCNLARDFNNDKDFLEEIGAHAKGLNLESVGICCVGNFDVTSPTIYQQKACLELLVFLVHRFPWIRPENILGHREIEIVGAPKVTKSCPGKHVNCMEVRRMVNMFLDNYFEDYSKIVSLHLEQNPDILWYNGK